MLRSDTYQKAAKVLMAAAVLALLAGCSAAQETERMTGQIFLVGERHAREEMYQKEFEIWSAYYNEYGMRDLFLEYACYTAEYLNVWMQSDSDDILNTIYDDLDGTPSHTQDFLDFFRRIKAECPETVFHGTDLGLPNEPAGVHFLAYLDAAGQADSELYRLTQESMAQGEQFYPDYDYAYREVQMVENFIRAVESLDGANIMGIYGAFHVDVNETNHGSHEVPSMAHQLQDQYGSNLHIRDLTLAKIPIDDPCPGEPSPDEPSQTDTITIGEKAYPAQYLGKAAMSACYPEYQFREFWLVEGAYDDFKYKNLSDILLPHDNFPVEVEFNQVYAVDYTKTDGSVMREFYQSNRGISYGGWLAAVRFYP